MSSSAYRSRLGPVGLACGHLLDVSGQRPTKGTAMWCRWHEYMSVVDRVYPKGRCFARGKDSASLTLRLCCTLAPHIAGDHHDELAGRKFEAVRLRSGFEGNPGRRP